jgi:hypothetical protein
MYWVQKPRMIRILENHVLPCSFNESTWEDVRVQESRWEYMIFFNSHNSRFLHPLHRGTLEYMRVYESTWKYKRVHESSHVLLCTGSKNLELWEFKKLMYSHLLSMRIHGSTWEYIIFLNSHNSRFLGQYIGVHENTWEYKRLHGSAREYMRALMYSYVLGPKI